MAVTARRWQVTTRADRALPVAPNRLARQFTVATPNRVWAADLTYCWTQEGWPYLAVVLDLCSRRVVGWATSPSPDAQVALAAWQRAVAVRQPAPGLLHHSDRGSIPGFNRSLQHCWVALIVVGRSAFRQGFASRASGAVGC